MTLMLSVTDTTITLPQLLERARQGADIIVTETGKPVARFILLDADSYPARPSSPLRRVPGTAKGQIIIESPLPR